MTLLLLSACSDYAVQDQGKVYGASDNAPHIEVDPLTIDFGAFAAEESAIATVTLRSVGEEDLRIFSVGITGSGAFTLAEPVATVVLPPGEETTFDVVYTPANAEDRAQIDITSNDPDLGTALVSVTGAGLFPELVIAPADYDFGDVPVGCDATAALGLYNNGLAPLTVTTLAQVGIEFTAEADGLPLVIAPGGSAPVSVHYTPADTARAEGELWVESDDPRGFQTAAQSGEGTEAGSGEDDFWQGDGPWEKTDILVYVDQSCSMGDDQLNLADNFSQFVTALGAVAIDWQLAIVTADDGCANGSLYRFDTPDLEGAVLAGVTRGGGRWTEAGLTISKNALEETGSGGCNADFLREDSKTTVILVSDEPEQSPSPWDDLVAEILDLAPTASIHSVVGDVPDGCSTAAPGTGYQEASLTTGGAVLSICGADWGSYFELIATLASTGATASFPLSGYPDPDSIDVTVDDARSSVWSYREDLNAIEFPLWAIPPGGSLIHVTYDYPEDCGG